MPEKAEIIKNSFGLFIGVGQRAADSTYMQISASDAEYIHLAFQHYCGKDFQQPLVNDSANKNNILQQLDDIAGKTAVAVADLVVFYFSGHGCEWKDKYYLICNNTTSDNVEETAINGDELLKKLLAINCEKMLVLLDCCHAGGIGKPNDLPFRVDSFKDKPNHVVLTACHHSQVSYLSNPVSIFTYALIEGLSGWYFLEEDKFVRLFDLAMYVRERVVWLSENNLQIEQAGIQKPQLYVLPESKTSNFTIASHPNGKPLKKFFKAELEAIKDVEGKDLNIVEGRTGDKKFRDTFKWIKNNTVSIAGDKNIVIQDNSGHVTVINNGIPADEFKSIVDGLTGKMFEKVLELLQVSGNVSLLKEATKIKNSNLLEKQMLEENLELLLEKLSDLSKASIISSDAAQKFTLKKQIGQTNREIDDVKLQLGKFD